jgi:uncharacterized membrane-anchored protein
LERKARINILGEFTEIWSIKIFASLNFPIIIDLSSLLEAIYKLESDENKCFSVLTCQIIILIHVIIFMLFCKLDLNCAMALLKLDIDGADKLNLLCIVKRQVSFHSSLTSSVTLSI